MSLACRAVVVLVELNLAVLATEWAGSDQTDERAKRSDDVAHSLVLSTSSMGSGKPESVGLLAEGDRGSQTPQFADEGEDRL
jgi:hypothetical protein